MQSPPSIDSTPDLSRPLLAERVSPKRTRVVLLVNRKAGAGRGRRRVDEAVRLLTAAGFEVVRAGSPEELEEATAAANQEQALRAVVAVGGDGTVGLALNRTPDGTPLAVMPAGTENLLAKYLEHRPQPHELAALLREGVQVRLDAGEANGRLFALMFSAGFDAEVIRRVHQARRGNITHLAYAKPFFAALRSYSYPPIEATWSSPDGGSTGVDTGRWLFGMNLPRYAQGLPISPEATGADGLLDLCVFRRGNAASAVWYLWNLLRRRHHRLPSVSIRLCGEFTVKSASGEPTPYQLDGDPGGFLPATVKSAPGRLSLIVMPEVAARLGFRLPD